MTDDATTVAELARRLAEVEEQLVAVREEAARARDRGAVENVFNRYMHYHNAYEDQRIIDELWARPVWAHWVWCKYGVDFVKQDGEWRIWHFRCYEIARAPFDRDWVSFAADNQQSHDSHLAWFGDDGVPVYLPSVDAPVETQYMPYANDRAQTFDPVPPLPYAEFEDTFK